MAFASEPNTRRYLRVHRTRVPTGSFGPIREVAIRAIPDELEAAGVRRCDVTLACANALYRMLRPSELARLLGDDLVRKFGARLICHDHAPKELG